MASCLEDKDITRALTGDIIEIWTRPKKKRYLVHASLLKPYPWFRARIRPPSRYETVSSLFLDAEDSAVFDLLINWLYRKDLAAISPRDEKLAKQQASRYLFLYIYAGNWGIPELQNFVIDLFRNRPTCEYGWFPSDLIGYIYRETSPGSPLRSYVVDTFVFKSYGWPPGMALNKVKEQSLADNREFVGDCYETLLEAAIGRSKVKNPNRKAICAYHVHKNGEECV